MQVNVINVASDGQYGLGLLAAAIHVGGGTCLQILMTPAQWQICLKILHSYRAIMQAKSSQNTSLKLYKILRDENAIANKGS